MRQRVNPRDVTVPNRRRNKDYLRNGLAVVLSVLFVWSSLGALYLFGAFVERLAGRWEMFVVFMVAGICGSAASTWLGNPPRETFIRTPPIPAHGSSTFDQAVNALGGRAGSLAVECSR